MRKSTSALLGASCRSCSWSALDLAACGNDDTKLKVTGIEPEKGDVEGGTYVRIKGNRFIADGARSAKVYFGSRQGTVIRFASDSEMIVEAPGGKVGETVDVLIIFEPGGELKIAEGLHVRREEQHGQARTSTSTRRSPEATETSERRRRRARDAARAQREVQPEQLLAEQHERVVADGALAVDLDERAVRAAEVGEEHAAVAQRDARVEARDVAVVGEVDLAALAAERDAARRAAGTPRR